MISKAKIENPLELLPQSLETLSLGSFSCHVRSPGVLRLPGVKNTEKAGKKETPKEPQPF
jgi:hypothetical protein